VRIFLLFTVFFLFVLQAREYKIGFPQDTLSNDWRKAQVLQVQEEVKKYPFLTLDVRDAQGKVSNQIADMEYFIDNNYDFIITSPIHAQISSKVLKKAIDKNIKVILLSRGIQGDEYTTFIRPDNYKIAYEAGIYLAKKLNYKGTVLMLEGIKTASTTQKRTQGFMDAIKKYPNIKVITQTANYLRVDAINVMEELYLNHTHFDAIFSHSDSMLSGARTVMKKYGQKLNLPTVGMDYFKEVKEAILNEEQTASFVYPTGAKEGIDAIVNIIHNKKVAKEIFLPTQLVTKENAHNVEPIF
jgi:ABC-type sugar transport system substrate-binding protein